VTDVIDLAEYMDLLAPFYGMDMAHVWLLTPQPLLDGAVPLDLIRKGDGHRVLAIIHQLRDSVHV
jgi:uncharacterized protein (DUF2384 family)